MDKVDQSGRYLLYSNRHQSFEVNQFLVFTILFIACFFNQVDIFQVWTEYQSCYSGRKDALCICSVEVRSLFGDETFLMDRCKPAHPKRTSHSYDVMGGRRSLPKISLTGRTRKSRKTFKVLESRQGKLITVFNLTFLTFF